MRITLLMGGLVPVDFLAPLARFLRSKMADAEVDQAFLPSVLDLPLAVKEASGDSELVFVFLWSKKLSALDELALGKIVDVELATGVRVLKGWGVVSSASAAGDEAVEKLASRWGQVIVDWVTNPSSFIPGKPLVEDDEEGLDDEGPMSDWKGIL